MLEWGKSLYKKGQPMYIKKRSLLLLLASASNLRADVYGLSYLTTRPRFELNFPERITMFRTLMDARDGGHGGAFQAVFFGGSTTQAQDLARYFLPNGKDYLIVAEDQSIAARARVRDINAFNLGILTIPANETYNDFQANLAQITYEGHLSFKPSSKVFGVGFTYAQRFGHDWWFDIAAPLMKVKNTMGLHEDIISPGSSLTNDSRTDGFFNNATDAFSCQNENLKYGHITCKTIASKVRFSHVEARVGHDVLNSGTCVWGAYGGLTIPAGTKPTQEYLFEPMVGNNKHLGLFVGTYGAFQLHRDPKDRTFGALLNVITRYFVSNNQLRSFDLKGKPWSRYMLVVKNRDTLPNAGDGTTTSIPQGFAHFEPLINTSTFCVQVKPHFSFDYNTAILYQDHAFSAEVGYNLYARKAEEICFNKPFKGGSAVNAINYWLGAPTASHTTPKSYSAATPDTPIFYDVDTATDWDWNIGATSTQTYVPLTINDLDPNSAATPATVCQTFYGALGYEWSEIKYPCVLSAGGSYEFSRDNTSPRRWTVWLKGGIAF